MTNEESEKNSGFLSQIKQLAEFILPKGAAALAAVYLFVNLLAMPIIKYNKNTGELTVTNSVRSVSLYPHPQIVVKYNNEIIQLIHLIGYFKHDVVYFEDGKASLEETDPQCSDRLLSCIRTQVIDKCPAVNAPEIDSHLDIYIGMVCGVRYQTRFGNTVNRYCIIEDDGMVVDCSPDSAEVKNRLFDYDLVLSDDPNWISQSCEVTELVDFIAEEVNDRYDSAA